MVISLIYLYYSRALIQLVIEKYSNQLKIVNWCRHKRYTCVASGINPYYSKMDNDVFFAIIKNINAVKCLYF